ncbi:uncharacterized protein LOC126485006 [Schistocerca serialis cubense]|uniref:uncharacterized protein LOC126485006 n=1 Tax=Schistocerca serialis cubense TaxID=2023355 RepID=UPI00214E8E94|nr:uncharacterized protein LOC126485006 [Schistocerca serialis cubense]
MARELRPGSTACITHKHTPQYSGGDGAAPAACPCVHAARRASARDWRQQRRLHPSAGTGRSALGISVECCGSWQLASGEGKWDEASAKAALQQDGPGGRARGCSQPAIFAAAAAAAAAEAEAAAAAARDAGPAVRGPASSEHGLQRRARRSLSSYGGAGGRGPRRNSTPHTHVSEKMRRERGNCESSSVEIDRRAEAACGDCGGHGPAAGHRPRDAGTPAPPPLARR